VGNIYSLASKFSKSRNAPGGLTNPPDFADLRLRPARAICDLLKFLARLLVLAGAFLLLAACQGGPAPERADIAPLSQELPSSAQLPGGTTTAEASVALKIAPSTPIEAWSTERYGLIAGSIDDKSFNQLAWSGLQRATQELGVEMQHLETQPVEAEQNINQFIDQRYSGIVTVGFLMAEAARTASQANPTLPFIAVDVPSQTSSDLGLLFATDEPAFMAGYVAAAMSQTGVVCTYGGVEIPPVLIFMVGFEHGVKYYNQQHGANVQVLGWRTDPALAVGGEGVFAGNFDNQEDGRRLAETFFAEGCDILFPVAGGVGLGSAAVAQEQGLTVIGVDADLTQTAPEFGEVYLTSVLKKVDVAVFEAIKQMHEGRFEGGTNYVGTLANDGVGLAPFHAYEDKIPEMLRVELEQIRQGLIDDTISTGWPIR
jgi:basic membrane protein A and related proteins